MAFTMITVRIWAMLLNTCCRFWVRRGMRGSLERHAHIIDFMVEIVAPTKEERVLDPACGTAGLSHLGVQIHSQAQFIELQSDRGYSQFCADG